MVFKSPSKYVQGFGVLGEVEKYLVDSMGKNLFVIMDPVVEETVKPMLNQCIDKGYTIAYAAFQGECSRKNIEKYIELAKSAGATTVFGVGGGKTMDTAKGVAHLSGMSLVIVPTAASTDAPCSSVSVMYHEDGEFDDWLFLNANPNLVLVDTSVIVKAPVKLLVAGMGDALSTYFEARVCRASGSKNQAKASPTIAATTLAEKCWEILARDGVRAKLAAEAGVCTPAFEAVVEINTLLSSVGFESGGLGAAHAIQKGFTLIPELHRAFHGYIVAFCTITQLVMENVDDTQLNAVLKFCKDVGLPICFADFGYHDVDYDLLWEVADKTNKIGVSVHHLPFEVNTQMIYDGLLAADAIGRAYHANYA
ncbi:glycerol dehydrogenase [Chakrabartyella piscis]|uniref:glycerol dehydrogenase n=1 Tax=Chakrabartyella piscis TaxID=2918914 RepID=UPI0029584E95|nr:glycerol dehydrogenase [Chakrabartyella piscis]